jgi:putative ABC transport system permease protein
VLRRGLRWCAVGTAIGTAAAIGASHLARSLVWGVGPLEPAPYVSSILLLGALALAACALPAVQAMRVDPAVVLREEG